MIIGTDSPYSMADDLPFEVGGLVYTSVWQWVVCDSALAANDVLCFIAARKGHHGVLDGLDGLDGLGGMDKENVFQRLQRVALLKFGSIPGKNHLYMVHDRFFGTGITVGEQRHGFPIVGENMWGRALDAVATDGACLAAQCPTVQTPAVKAVSTD